MIRKIFNLLKIVLIDHTGYFVFAATMPCSYWGVTTWTDGLHDLSIQILTPAFIILLVGFAGFLAFRLESMYKYSHSIERLVAIYIELILLFTCIYFWANFIASTTVVISEMSRSFIPYITSKEPIDHESYRNSLVELFVDCLYFTVSTSSTVGYGDMHPDHSLTKLISVLQMMCTFAVVGIGITKHANRKTASI